MTVDARFFFAALEGLSDADVERAVLPFPSHEVDPYRGLKPHFDIASARARALHGIASGTARLARRVGAGAPAAPGAARAADAHGAHADAGPGHLADGARGALRRGRLYAPGSGRRIRRVLRARRRRGLLPRGRRRADPPRVRRRHHRIDPRLRPRHAAIERRARPGGDRAAAGAAWRCRRSGSFGHGLRLLLGTAGRSCSCPSRTKSRRTARSCGSRSRRATTRRSRRASAWPRPEDAAGRLGRR